MPSTEPIPTIAQMIRVADAELWSRRRTTDRHSGSVYNVHAGVGGMLWIREANRDRANFQRCYMDTCEGDVLDWRIQAFDGPARVQDTKGKGGAHFTRASTAGGPGTLWAGTRIAIGAIGQTPRFYRVKKDTHVDGLTVDLMVDIESESVGPDSTIDSTLLPSLRMWIEDPLWDTWSVVTLKCGVDKHLPGTFRETDAEYRARWRDSRQEVRPGHRTSITNAMVAAGAAYVVLYESDFITGVDDGICRVCVADSDWESPQSLLNNCTLALEDVRVAGCDTEVLGITRVNASFSITATMRGNLSMYNAEAIKQAIVNGVMYYFSAQENRFMFRRVGLIGTILQSCKDAQSVELGPTDPVDTDLSALLGSTTIQMLVIEPSSISVELVGS